MKNRNIVETSLSKAVKIGQVESKNRFCIQPMECGDSDFKGRFTEDTLRRYQNLFYGGAGMIVMESVTLQYKSRARENQLLLDLTDYENRKMWESFVKDIKLKYPKTILIVQLNHSGELSETEFSQRVSVKPMEPFGGQLINSDYIDNALNQFVEASRFFYEIGCDGVDLKFCQGYLGSQLLRPYNDRIWKYGGTWENRSRFAFDMCEKVRKAVNNPKFLVGAKVSVFEDIVGGQGHVNAESKKLNLDETFDLCKGLEARGANFFIETLGNAGLSWNLLCPNRENSDNVYKHIVMAKALKSILKPETIVIGSGLSLLADGRANEKYGLTSKQNSLLHWGNFCIDKGYFDMIALGRQSIADPFLPRKYVEGLEKNIKWCLCCGGCTKLLTQQKHTGCTVYNKYYADMIKNH